MVAHRLLKIRRKRKRQEKERETDTREKVRPDEPGALINVPELRVRVLATAPAQHSTHFPVLIQN